MSETPGETSAADVLNAALIDFTGCIGEALPDICSYGLTIGEMYIPFDPDPEDECDDDEAACSQAWVRVADVRPLRLIESSFGSGDGCAVVFSVELEVGVLRCFGITDEGEAPAAADVLIAATGSMDDMMAIYNAAMKCPVWDDIKSGSWVPLGPHGGQYGGIWSFTVETQSPLDCMDAS